MMMDWRIYSIEVPISAVSRRIYCVLCNWSVSVREQNEEGKKENNVSVDAVYILSTVETEDIYTPARLEVLFRSSQSSLRHSCLPGFQVQVSLRATVFSIHPHVSWRDLQFCLSCSRVQPADVFLWSTVAYTAKHRISTCLNPPGPHRCWKWRAESEYLSRRTEMLQRSCLKSSSRPRSSPAHALAALSSASLKLRLINVCFRLRFHIVTPCNEKRQRFGALPKLRPNMGHYGQLIGLKTKTGIVRAFETSCQLFHCALALCCGIEDFCWMAKCMSGLQGAMNMSFATGVRKFE